MTGVEISELIGALADKPYARDLFGIRLIDASPGSVTLEIVHRPDLGHLPGWFQGAVTSAIGELAASWSTMTIVPAKCRTATIEQSIRFTGPARGERLVAVGRVISAGRTISVGGAEIYAEQGSERRLCAVLTLTNHHSSAC